MMIRRHLLGGFAGLAGLLFSILCSLTVASERNSGNLGTPEQARASGFYVPGIATSETLQEIDGRKQMTYWIPLANPGAASDFLYPWSRWMAHHGWSLVRAGDSGNTGPLLRNEVPSWGLYDDHTVTPFRTVLEWTSRWFNQEGDVAIYDMAYSYPTGHPYDHTKMKVVGILFPASLIKTIGESAIPVRSTKTLKIPLEDQPTSETIEIPLEGNPTKENLKGAFKSRGFTFVPAGATPPEDTPPPDM